MSLLSWLFKKESKPCGTFTKDEVNSILKVRTLVNDAVLTDTRYNKYTRKDFEKALGSTDAQMRTYEENNWDCDNFAFDLYVQMEKKLKGCVFGVLFIKLGVRGHSLNFFIDDIGAFRIVEPQTGMIMDKTDWTVFFVLI